MGLDSIRSSSHGRCFTSNWKVSGMRKLLAAPIIALLIIMGVSAPASALVYNCSYGYATIFNTSSGPDTFMSITNESGKTANIRVTLYHYINGTKTIYYYLNVSNGGRKYISQNYTYMKVEYKRSDWSSYKFGCERVG